MSTIEEFENAPVGSIAKKGVGLVAIREGYETAYLPWVCTTYGEWFSNEELADAGYTLERPVPTTVQEALDLAWNLAAPVEEDQTIPKGTRYVRRSQFGGLTTYTAAPDWTPDPWHKDMIRTFEPLPEPEPDWLNAPAVLASMNECSWQKVWLPRSEGYWECTCCGAYKHWSAMADVTPLYPKEDVEPGKSDTPNDAPRTYSACLNYDGPWGTRLGGDPA